MKFSIMLLLTIVCSLFFCGCSGPKVMVDGIEYEALTEEEELRLCYLARLYLKNNVPKVISIQEARMISNYDPMCHIKYNGDRTGRAIVRWELTKRNVEVVFDGELLKPSAKCWAQTEEKYPEVLDFTRKGSLQKQSNAVKPEPTPDSRIPRSRKKRRK